jgi:hypothetical protein
LGPRHFTNLEKTGGEYKNYQRIEPHPNNDEHARFQVIKPYQPYKKFKTNDYV